MYSSLIFSKYMRDLTILTTASGAQFMPGLVSCLHNNGERKVKVIGVDMKSDETLLQMVDEYFLVPSASDPHYVDALLEICSNEKVDVLMPFMSSELEELQKT